MTSVTRRIGLALAVLALAAVGRAEAGQIIDTTGSWNGVYGMAPFGVPDWATFGETVTVPVDGNSRLDSFTFYIKGPGTQSFLGYVYAWDGSKATGGALYTSPAMSLAGTGGFEEVTFHTGGVDLTPGGQYVLFASVSDPSVYPTSSGQSVWGYTVSEVYSGGGIALLDNGNDPTKWTSQPWARGVFDLAFKASFDTPGVATPEPSTLVPAGTAGLTGLGYAWRRRKARPAT